MHLISEAITDPRCLGRAQVIFDSRLVEPFTNAASDNSLEPPKSVQDAFMSSKETVRDFLRVVGPSRGTQFIDNVQDVLLCPLGVDPGEYAAYHEVVARVKVRFSHIVCH